MSAADEALLRAADDAVRGLFGAHARGALLLYDAATGVDADGRGAGGADSGNGAPGEFYTWIGLDARARVRARASEHA